MAEQRDAAPVHKIKSSPFRILLNEDKTYPHEPKWLLKLPAIRQYMSNT